MAPGSTKRLPRLALHAKAWQTASTECKISLVGATLADAGMTASVVHRFEECPRRRRRQSRRRRRRRRRLTLCVAGFWPLRTEAEANAAALVHVDRASFNGVDYYQPDDFVGAQYFWTDAGVRTTCDPNTRSSLNAVVAAAGSAAARDARFRNRPAVAAAAADAAFLTSLRCRASTTHATPIARPTRLPATATARRARACRWTTMTCFRAKTLRGTPLRDFSEGLAVARHFGWNAPCCYNGHTGPIRRKRMGLYGSGSRLRAQPRRKQDLYDRRVDPGLAAT